MTATGGKRGWQKRATDLRRDVIALFFAVRDRRTPWYARLLAGAVVAYALSPIDLIPDFIPVIGYADDLLIVPLAVLLVRRLVPAAVLAEHRASAERINRLPHLWVGAIAVVVLWLALGLLAAALVLRALDR